MIKNAPYKFNIEFLISQLKREIEYHNKQKQINYDLIESYESLIDDLKYIIEISK